MKHKLIGLVSAALIYLNPSFAMPAVNPNSTATMYTFTLPVLDNDIVITSENITETKIHYYQQSLFKLFGIDNTPELFSLLNLDSDPDTKEGYIIRRQNNELRIALDTNHDGKLDTMALLSDMGWSYSRIENGLSAIEDYNEWTSEDSEILQHEKEKFSYTIPKFKQALSSVFYTSKDFFAEFKMLDGAAFIAYVGDMLQRPQGVHVQFGNNVFLFYDAGNDLKVDFIAKSVDGGMTFTEFIDFKRVDATLFDVYTGLIAAEREYEKQSKPRRDFR
jgi:hypothetical protein